MDFSSSLEEALNNVNKNKKVLTENGAIAYKNTKHSINDFMFQLTELRSADWNTIGKEFSKVFYEEDIDIATKFFAYILDVREGAAERNISKGILYWLVENHSDIVEKIYSLIPFYGRWDIAILLCDPQFNSNEKLREKVLTTIKQQFITDLKAIPQNKPISLLGKWMPSENSSSKETKRKARQLMFDLNIKPKTYRRGLSALRHVLHVVECDMSANRWENIAYEHVPSKANLNYSNAFMRHDKERREGYLESLKKGETKINARVLAPYEIVNKYCGGYYSVKKYDEALEQMWKNLNNITFDNLMVVRDGSGSMTNKCTGNTSCLDVATSLAIYAAEHNKGAWKDKFITFSSHPEFVNMSKCSSLKEKIELCLQYNECENTDIFSTMKLILDTAVKNKCKQEDIPDILIISDMAFDSGPVHDYGWRTGRTYTSTFNYDDTLFEKIQKMYAQKGYRLPKLIFWNVNARGTTTVPIQSNELGMSLVSGFSTNIFNMVLSKELDPYKQLLSILNSERYQPVENALQV